MNFLGHCYLCQDHFHLITGNLGGDFYKGNLSNFNHLPNHLQQGIKFHRFIDEFTDQSDSIIEVAHIFQKAGIPKVSFIACDILVDHYLSKNWSNYSAIPYDQFIEEIYSEVQGNLHLTEPDFQFLFNKMKEYGWFYEYPTIEGISLILRQFSRRMKFDNHLDSCVNIYLANKKTIDACFETFLKSIKNRSDEFILDEKLNIP